jgi:hypothetical protein
MDALLPKPPSKGGKSVKKSEPLDKAKIIDLKSRKVLADLPSPDAGDKPPHGDLTIQDVRGYPAEQNALRHHLKHMAEHYHSWQNYEGAAAAVSNPVHKKRNLAQAEKHKIAHQTHLNWARGEHSRLKGLPPVHVMERNALEQAEYKSGAMVDKFTPHPDDTKPRPKLVKSEPLDKAKIYSFESKEMLAEQPGRPTARRAEKVVADGSQKVAGQIVPGNQRDEDRASGRTPKNLGVIAGMKVLHGTHPSHKGRAGYHMDNPSVQDFVEGLESAIGKGMDTIYVHGSRPSTKALKEISRKYQPVGQKENDMKKTLRPGQSIADLEKAKRKTPPPSPHSHDPAYKKAIDSMPHKQVSQLVVDKAAELTHKAFTSWNQTAGMGQVHLVHKDGAVDVVNDAAADLPPGHEVVATFGGNQTKEQVSGKIHEALRKLPVLPGLVMKKSLQPGQSIQDLAKAGCQHCNMTYAEMGPMKGSFHERGCPMDGAVSCESCGEAVPKREVYQANDWDGLKYCKDCADQQARYEAEENKDE